LKLYVADMLRCHLLKQDGAEMWCIGFQNVQEGVSILGG